MRMLIFATLSVLMHVNAHAAQVLQTWQSLSDSSPSGPFFDMAPGPDLLWGTGDEVTIAGQNTSGHSGYSTFDAAPGLIFSVFGGSWTQVVDTVTFDFNYESLDIAGTFNCPGAIGCVPAAVNEPFTVSLASVPGPVPAASINAGGAIGFQVAGYQLDSLVSDGTIFRRNGTSYLLFPGQDAAALFGADIATHFSEVLTSTVLPTNPVLAYWVEEFEGIAGPSPGFTGVQTGTAYLVDQVVVPLPAALPLMLSALAIFQWKSANRRRTSEGRHAHARLCVDTYCVTGHGS